MTPYPFLVATEPAPLWMVLVSLVVSVAIVGTLAYRYRIQITRR